MGAWLRVRGRASGAQGTRSPAPGERGALRGRARIDEGGAGAAQGPANRQRMDARAPSSMDMGPSPRRARGAHPGLGEPRN